jgi:hypothetical protein
MNITYSIARYEKLSDYFLVAFNICSENGDSAYIESYLNHEEIIEKTSQEICQLAYEKIKVKIEILKQKFEANSVSVVGYQFIPVE